MKNLRVLTICTISLLISFMFLTGCSSPASNNETSVSIEISDSDYEPMNEYIECLRETFSKSSYDELFPAEEIPNDELLWFLNDDEDVTVEDIKGIRFANSDILIVYFYSTELSDETLIEHVTTNIAMYGKPLIPPPEVTEYTGNTSVISGFGAIAYSFYGSELDYEILSAASDARAACDDE